LIFSKSEFFNVYECEGKVSQKVSTPIFLERRRNLTLEKGFTWTGEFPRNDRTSSKSNHFSTTIIREISRQKEPIFEFAGVIGNDFWAQSNTFSRVKLRLLSKKIGLDTFQETFASHS